LWRSAIVALATSAHGQEAGTGAPPCFGSDGGTYQCRSLPGAGAVAVRAGRLFDSIAGRMLTD